MSPIRNADELAQVLEARTTENRHLRAEVCRLKREDAHVRWVFERVGRLRAVAAAQLAIKAARSANAAAALATERANRAEAELRRRDRALQVSRIFDVPVSVLAGPADADPVSGDGFVEVTGRALYVDEVAE
jgi:hypothetical protein